MARSIVCGTRVRPSSRAIGRDVPGYDEDAFTLAVASIESLPSGDAPETLHVVGGATLADDWALREALGWPHLQVRRHAEGAGSLFATLSDGARSDHVGDEVVVAVDGGSEVAGAGAIAFRIAAAPGISVLGHRARGHPDWQRPDATAWTDAGRHALGGAHGDTGELFLVSPAAPPVLLQRWAAAMPNMPVRHAPLPDPGVGDSATLRAALALQRGVDSKPAGSTALVALLEPGLSTSFLGIRVGAPIPWSGDWSEGDPGVERRAAGEAGAAVEAVSQGAYVPRDTYLAELPSRWRLGADRCAACGRVTFPVRGVCRHCGASDRLERFELPRRDLEVLASTTVAPGAQPTEFDPQVRANGAYDVVVVALGPSVRGTMQVADVPVRTLRVGDRVDAHLRRLYATEGEWRYGLKATRRAPP